MGYSACTAASGSGVAIPCNKINVATLLYFLVFFQGFCFLQPCCPCPKLWDQETTKLRSCDFDPPMWVPSAPIEFLMRIMMVNDRIGRSTSSTEYVIAPGSSMLRDNAIFSSGKYGKSIWLLQHSAKEMISTISFLYTCIIMHRTCISRLRATFTSWNLKPSTLKMHASIKKILTIE